jgi:hypothetical protein
MGSALRFLCLLLFGSEEFTEDNQGNEAGILAPKHSVQLTPPVVAAR